MADLQELFLALIESRVAENGVGEYHAAPIRDRGVFLLAKLVGGYPCVLIATTSDDNALPAPIKLEHLTVQHGVSGRIKGVGVSENAQFSSICLTSSDEPLINVFLRFAVFLCGNLGEQPAARAVAAAIRQLVDMLQTLRQPSRNTIQGLWGELFLIASAESARKWFDAWHNDPLELHDFCFPEGRIEAKSASGELRKHRFSHRQLWPPPGRPLAIASLLVASANTGSSVFDLATEIRSNLDMVAALRLDRIIFESLGNDFRRADEVRFDKDAAAAALRFYVIGTVPRLREETPDLISEISYSITFIENEGVKELDWIS